MKKIYRSFQGREVDMEALMRRNETMPAVGNVRVNARGDELGPDGKIIRTREDILSEYYDNNPNAIDDEEIAAARVKIQSRKKQVETVQEEKQPELQTFKIKPREPK